MDDSQKREKRVPLLLNEAELARLDDWRFANRMPSRTDAVREALEIAYQHKPIIKPVAKGRAKRGKG